MRRSGAQAAISFFAFEAYWVTPHRGDGRKSSISAGGPLPGVFWSTKCPRRAGHDQPGQPAHSRKRKGL